MRLHIQNISQYFCTRLTLCCDFSCTKFSHIRQDFFTGTCRISVYGIFIKFHVLNYSCFGALSVIFVMQNFVNDGSSGMSYRECIIQDNAIWSFNICYFICPFIHVTTHCFINIHNVKLDMFCPGLYWLLFILHVIRLNVAFYTFYTLTSSNDQMSNH